MSPAAGGLPPNSHRPATLYRNKRDWRAVMSTPLTGPAVDKQPPLGPPTSTSTPGKLLTLTEQTRQSVLLQQKLEAAGYAKKLKRAGENVAPSAPVALVPASGRSPFLAPASRKRKRLVSAIDQKRRLVCESCGQVSVVSFGDYVNGCSLCGAMMSSFSSALIAEDHQPAACLSESPADFHHASSSDTNMW